MLNGDLSGAIFEVPNADRRIKSKRNPREINIILSPTINNERNSIDER